MKFRWKWALSVAGLAFLALAVVSAKWSYEEKNEARVAAGERIDATTDAMSRIVRGLLVEARAKLDGADPASPAPPPFDKLAVDSTGGSVTDRETIHAPLLDLWFRFGAENVRVWKKTGPDSYVSGRIPIAELERRLAADPDVGTLEHGRWYRRMVLGEDGEVMFPHQDPRDELRRQRARGTVRITTGQSEIRAGKSSERTAKGLPENYKDADDKLVIASWREVLGFEKRLWVLAEVRDADVVGGTGGIPLKAGGIDLGEAMPWHAALAMGLLCLVASAFFWLPTRGGVGIGVLTRTYSFAKPYAWGIVAAIVVGAIYGFARASRAFIAKSLVDDVIAPGQDASDGERAVIRIVIITLGLGVVLAVTNYFKEYLQNYYSTAMMADIRVAISRKIVSLPLSFFNRMRAGDLVARIERDVSGMRQVLNQVFEKAFVQPFTMVGSIVVAFMMDWRLALVLFGLPLLVLPVFRIAKKIKKRAEKRQNLLADMSHVLLQMLTGIKVVKAFHGEEREANRLDRANRRFIHEARRIARLSAISDSTLDFLQMVGGAIVVYIGGHFALRGEVKIGELVGFVVVILSVYDSAKDIVSVLNKLIEALPSVERVYQVFDTENDLKDGPQIAPSGPLVTGIELRGLRFRYLENEILKGVDLTIPAGKVVAVVGPTGAGKTTLCDLVARFYDPTEGQVLWDGVDAREYTTKSLSAKLAIVTQDAFLFNAPIDENIRYGKEDATEAEVLAAASDANIHDEIVLMEGGYSKMVGERGMSLSGGQRQRVTIARALIKDAPVLILDEATSNLDSASEQRVQAALAKLMSGRTVIVVAHRLSTIRNADKVVVVDGGRIVEEGAPDDLLKIPGSRFRQMYDLQTGGGDEAGDAAPVPA